MRRRLLRWFAPVAVALACWLPSARAQTPPAPPQAGPDAEKPERSPPALQYALAILFTLAVLSIVCKPSRKG